SLQGWRERSSVSCLHHLQHPADVSIGRAVPMLSPSAARGFPRGKRRMSPGARSPAIAGASLRSSLRSRHEALQGRLGYACHTLVPRFRTASYMKTEVSVRPSESLRHVRYEIRGKLARRAHEMQRMGYEIISLNIGNPGAFGFRTPETMRLAMI